jgi:hypothetical protein
MNTKVGKAMWAIIHSLQVNPTAAVHLEEEKSLGKKRKRGDKGGSTSDDEYRPDPVRHIGKPLKTRGKR